MMRTRRENRGIYLKMCAGIQVTLFRDIAQMCYNEILILKLLIFPSPLTNLRWNRRQQDIIMDLCVCRQCRISTQSLLPTGRLQTQKCLVRSCVSFHLIIHFIRCISIAAFLIGQQRQSVDRLALIANMYKRICQGAREGRPKTMALRRRRRWRDAMHLRDNVPRQTCGSHLSAHYDCLPPTLGRKFYAFM